MTSILRFLLPLLLLMLFASCKQEPQKILLFTQQNGNSLDAIKDQLQQLEDKQKAEILLAERSEYYSEEILSQYSVIAFLYCSGEMLDAVQRADIERFVQAGGTLIGVEAMPEVDHEWRWYTDHMSQASISSDQLINRLSAALRSPSLNYQLATTQRVPEENRFVKEILDFNLNEPMELDELPGRGLLFVERRGTLKLHDFKTATTKAIAQVPLFYGNEDGLLGIAVDPNYETNNWIYLFYSAPGDEPIQHISRFDLIGDSLHPASEKILLTVPTIRKCCHSGGSLEFGPNGNLFITLGDNTNPFESSGYAPIDERAGRALWDAQKSAANTNDLRGKILRIKPEDNGTYSIPEGNLFPPGTPNTRPEIYVMGCRNPFRPSIDSKTGYLYWGDVGPDAGKTDPNRGPKGMGEFNQARQAGFWGWPYTRGNNQVYNDYQFASQQSGEKFDPKRIINDSPNNTGIQELPPVQESMIWFSYDRSEEFPWLGKGGVNPMAGPIFHADDQAEGFPAYFENKLFVYEWMRDWVYVVTLDDNNEYVKAEAFMPETEFSHPMDMLFGKDGHLYVLEYGQKWNQRNLDARLSRIRYIKGNRAPIARIAADKEVGAIPLTVQFLGMESEDFDQDKLRYEWSFDSKEVQSTEVNPNYTFEQAGVYTVQLTVTDPSGERSSTTHKILAGNEPPQLSITTDSDDNIYWDRRTIKYQVVASDQEDGSTEDESLDPSNVTVTLTYLPEGEDIVLATIGHQQTTIPEGKQLIDASDCKACHAEEVKVNGPSYVDIAQKYTAEDKALLISRVIKGSSGVWGETMMAAHPQLSVQEVGTIIDYIFSLRPDKAVAGKKLPLSGSITFTDHMKGKSGGKYILMASYVDEGNKEVEESQLAVSEQVAFIPPKIEAEYADEKSEGLGVWDTRGATVVGSIAHNSWLKFDNVSFKQLESIQLAASYNADYAYAGSVEIREGSINGNLIGTAQLGYVNSEKPGREYYDIPLQPSKDKDAMYLVFKNQQDKEQYVLNADWVMLNYQR